MSDDAYQLDLDEIAYHEAGHAIAVVHFHEKLLSFTVGPKLHQVEWRCAGSKCGCALSRDAHTDIHVMIKIAGSVALSVYRGKSTLTDADRESAAPDWESARQLAGRRCLDAKERDAYLKWLERRIRAILVRDWDAVSVLGDHAIWQVNRAGALWSVAENTVTGLIASRMAPPWEATEGQ